MVAALLAYFSGSLTLTFLAGGPTDGKDGNMMNNFPLRGCKGGFFEGGIRVPAIVTGGSSNGLRPETRGSIVRNGLFHASDWLPTLLTLAKRGATGNLTAHHGLNLGVDERPFLPGDGVDSADWLSSGGAAASRRSDIIHAAQAEGSNLAFASLQQGLDMKVVFQPGGTDCGKDHAGWYPPPGLDWNDSLLGNLTVKCGEPPFPNPDITTICTSSSPCLYNISADPCEHTNLATDPDYAGILKNMTDGIARYQDTTVLPFTVFSNGNVPKADPRNFPPLYDSGTYVGVWTPYLTDVEADLLYPSTYDGPGYPPEAGNG